MNTEKSEKPSRTLLAAALTILVFAVASFVAIMLIEAQKVPTLENDTAWLESYFSRQRSRELSEQQKDIIHNSAAIVSNVAQDSGVTVRLKSVCGNGYITYFKVDVELPEGINAGYGCSFKEQRLKINENKIGLGSSGCSSQTLEDDNPTDNRYSLLMITRKDYDPSNDFAFNNGIVRTLHLENIQLEDESSQQSKLIEGQWEFSILFLDEGEGVEVVREPVTVRGIDWWEKSYYEAEITSFSLTEFSAYCQYKMTSKFEGSMFSLRPVVIMKDGRTVPAKESGGGNNNYSWKLAVPVSLDEVAFVKLTDEVVLPISQFSH